MVRIRPLVHRPDPVNPGKKGGKFYRDELGHVHYGERPIKHTANIDHFSTAKERERHTGVRHHVIEYSDSNDINKKYIHSPSGQTDVHAHSIQNRGGKVHAVYTARGRKMTQEQVQSLTTKREKELERLTEEAQRRANRGQGEFVVVSVSPKGTTESKLSILSQADLDAETEVAHKGGATVHTVKRVKPQAASQPAPAKNPRAKPVKKEQEHVDAEDVHAEATKSEEIALPEESITPIEEVTPSGRMAEDFWIAPLEGDKFITVPPQGFSYRQIGTISKSHGKNGLFTVTFEEEHGPLRKVDILPVDALRRMLDEGQIIVHDLIQLEEVAKSDWPACRHCGQAKAQSNPATGYCDECLKPINRWW